MLDWKTRPISRRSALGAAAALGAVGVGVAGRPDTAKGTGSAMHGGDTGSLHTGHGENRVVGEVDQDGITILGVGNVPCRGLRKGVVSNIEWTLDVFEVTPVSAVIRAGDEAFFTVTFAPHNDAEVHDTLRVYTNASSLPYVVVLEGDGYVRITTAAGTRDVGMDDPSDSTCNGWEYSNDMSQIVLCGDACDAIQNDPSPGLQVVFGCRAGRHLEHRSAGDGGVLGVGGGVGRRRRVGVGSGAVGGRRVGRRVRCGRGRRPPFIAVGRGGHPLIRRTSGASGPRRGGASCWRQGRGRRRRRRRGEGRGGHRGRSGRQGAGIGHGQRGFIKEARSVPGRNRPIDDRKRREIGGP